MIRLISTYCLLSLISGTAVFAQFKAKPIPRDRNPNDIHTTEALEDSVPLAFWEDFSTSTIPDTARWLPGSGVAITAYQGNNPPSLNVVSFDGLDTFGIPYSTDPESVDYTDSLVSRPIDLGSIPAGFENTVYLSFYYQKEGLGELPDEPDFIELQFRAADSSWVTVWPADPSDLTEDTQNFTFVSLLVDPVQFQHDKFQFRFRSFGRRNGPFDTWLVDYIYLDKGRVADDEDILDRAITHPPNSIFEKYTAVPIRQYLVDPDIMNGTSVDVTNFEISQPVQGIEYTSRVINKSTQLVIETLSDRIPLNILAGQTLTLSSPAPSFSSILPQIVADTVPLELEVLFFVDTGDTLLIESIDPIIFDTTYYDHVDLRVNDTIRSTFTLGDYFAYDDGTAEFGSGINQLEGRLAYQFILNQPDTLLSVDFSFTNVGFDPAGETIEVQILRDLADNPSSVLFTGNWTIPGNGINEFVNFDLLPDVAIIDTFYVAYRQFTDEFLTVGLDKNTDSGHRIFFNVAGTWEQNQEIAGSLMIRPHIGSGVIVSGLDDISPDMIRVFPNPSEGLIQVEGVFDEVEIYDLNGRKRNYRQNGRFLDLSALPESMYILRFIKGRKSVSRKIIIRH